MTETVTVNYWPRGKGSSFGHASLTLNKEIYISWWPSNSKTKGKLLCPAVKDQTMADDIKGENDAPPEKFPIQLSKDQVKKISEWWNQFKNDNMYEGITLNCSTVVFKALYAAIPELKENKLEDIAIWIPDAIQKLALALKEGIEELTGDDWAKLKKECSEMDKDVDAAIDLTDRFIQWLEEKIKKRFS